jgi:hypothetical protein
LERLVDELPGDLAGLSQVEQLLRTRFVELAGNMLQGWAEVAIAWVPIPVCPCCGKTMRHKGLKPITLATFCFVNGLLTVWPAAGRLANRHETHQHSDHDSHNQ